MTTTAPTPLVASLADILRLSEGVHACAVCSTPISHLGVCSECGTKKAVETHERKVLRFARSTIPARFAWAAFDSPELVRRVSPSLATSVRELLGKRLPGGVAIVGPSGAGKTSLGCAMLRRIHDAGTWEAPAAVVERARQAYFVSVPALRSSLREWRLGTEAPELLRLARSASVLVLDDLDDDPIQEVRDLLSDRHDRDRTTIITTWMDREKAAAVYGERLVRRAYERVIR